MSEILIMILVTVGGIAFIFVLIFVSSKLSLNYFAKRMRKMNQQSAPPEGYATVEENSYIAGVRQTPMMINQYPVMEVDIALFPQQGPMIVVGMTRSFSYTEIPYLKANAPVRISYEYNTDMIQSGETNSKAVRDIKIIGPAELEWEGDPKVKEAANLLVSRIEGSKLINAPGRILDIERTAALLGGNPVFRYRVSFQTAEGQQVEGETYQAARPWLEKQRSIGGMENVQYSATDFRDFIFEKR